MRTGPRHWPSKAATFLLLGGNDGFRGCVSIEDYLADTKSRVPDSNASTAILFVHEMTHNVAEVILFSDGASGGYRGPTGNPSQAHGGRKSA